MTNHSSTVPRRPGMLTSMIPVAVLITLITVGVRIFGVDITAGVSQISLCITALVVVFISMCFYGVSWSDIENGLNRTISNTGIAIFILMMIGCVTSTWMLSGVVPSIIYYGMKLISPKVFLLVTFLLTSLVSVLSGSSWTTIATIGVAMMGAGTFIGVHAGWLAGAIISGAYFGDKRSPMSDTCNLSATVAGVDLYTHMHYLLYTNLPSYILSGIVFTIAGFIIPTTGELDLAAQYAALEGTFIISPWLLLIPLFTIYLILKKVPAILTLLISAITGGIVAFLTQGTVVDQVCSSITGTGNRFFYFMMTVLANGTELETGNEMLNTLTATGGMQGMMNTVWLIMSVVFFGGVMEGSGMINAMAEKMAGTIKSAAGLVGSTVGTCIFCNIALSDQYMSIVVPGKIYAETYKKRGYAPELLSRSLEDSATVTSVLIPWNTCGVVQATVLGVATWTYLPYCIFNIASPIISIFVAAIGWKIRKLPQDGPQESTYIISTNNITDENNHE